ncbi:MAG TPA: NAD(P)H-binding protein [Pseudonocardiaceae bacterium]|nr:NAD(P)H-binding protein [Pseudonocardiaceae bacterium]
MRVAVAGGTGLVGKLVVTGLSAAGHEPVVLARSAGVDLTTGAGLAERLAGCGAVVDVTNVVTMRRAAAIEFFTKATGNLVTAAREAGAGHVIALSIVGIDRAKLGYYQGKLAQERVVAESGVPYTILRATQFFEFPVPLLAHRFPIAAMPRMLSQPVAAADVAEAIVELVDTAPTGRTVEIAGPERLRMAEVARRIERARGSRRPVLSIPLGRDLASGALIPQGEHLTGPTTFADYLATVR